MRVLLKRTKNLLEVQRNDPDPWATLGEIDSLVEVEMIEDRLRKQYPVATGVLDYFPDALMEVSHLSYVGNQKHNPGQPLHWDRAKSQDDADALIRHFLERGQVDTDGVRHSAKVAWRALALLQKELETDEI